MPINIRRATIADLITMQYTNLTNLPENYTFKFYLYHLLTWPQISFVATTTDPIDSFENELDFESDKKNENIEKLLQDLSLDNPLFKKGNEEQLLEIINENAKMDAQYINKNEKIVGYVLAKLNDDEEPSPEKDVNISTTGHVTSLSVMRTYRKLGIAEKLMLQSLKALRETHNADNVVLHVRESNGAALHLYKTKLTFTVLDIEKSYYMDGEDAYKMEKDLSLFDNLDHEGDDLESDLLQ
ncbi:hypothetical protein QEN19_001192 [Hanseniaspora menglaensis]